MSTNFQYDIFLSHSGADKARVRYLAERLKLAGQRVWFDEWIVQPGDDIYLSIERGLEASRTLVLCLSSAALRSDWVGLERSTALFRDPANTDRRFIPLLLSRCRLPDTLRRYKYVDLTRETDANFRQFLEFLNQQSACPSGMLRDPRDEPAACVQALPGTDSIPTQTSNSEASSELSVSQRVDVVADAATVTGVRAKRVKAGKLLIDQKTGVLGPDGNVTGAHIDELS